MPINYRVKVDLSGIKGYAEATLSQLRGSGRGPIRRAMRRWAFRFFTFVTKRFDTFSKGGGDWKDLAESTKKGRRGDQNFAILVNTGVLKAAVDPLMKDPPGKLDKDIPYGVRVGFGGPDQHKDSPLRIADIAMFHQEGGGNLPKREIIVDPPSPVLEAMARDLERGLQQELKDNQV